MNAHGLENKSTKGNKFVEVAEKLNLKGFIFYIRPNKLTSKEQSIYQMTLKKLTL